MSSTVAPRPRSKLSTPLIVTGSLVLAVGLTAIGNTPARAQRSEPDRLARMVPTHDATDLRVLDWALWNVSKYYVDPKRVDPGAMTLAGLEALEQTIPEVLVEPLGSGHRVRVRVGTKEREFESGDVEALWAVGPHIREVFRFVVDNAKLTEDAQRDAEYAVVAGVLSTLDPHTNLLRPDDFENMKFSTKGSFGGLGIEIGPRDGAITVIRVLEDNPAEEAGVLPGDRIVQIDEESTVTMDINDAVERLRGAPGTGVTIYVMRDGFEKPKALKITRATIQVNSVVGDILESTGPDGKAHKVGVLQIPQNFAQTTGQELRDQLAKFERSGVEGVVLDLRGNPGGLLNAAVEVADAFLSSGTIVATVGHHSPREESRADERYDFPQLPLVVVIDEGSASASEIVAGALSNLGRAILIGRRSFGKGSVQVLHDRRVGDKELALKLTIAQYLTPGDVSIQSVGVAPDLETIPVWVGKDHVAFFGHEGRFDVLREASLTAHLEGAKRASPSTSAHGPLYFLQPGSLGLKDEDAKAAPSKKAKTAAETRSQMLLEDPEIRIARDLVLWAPSAQRNASLDSLPKFLAHQTQVEQASIRKSLALRGIDWSSGPEPSSGKRPLLRVTMQLDKAGNVIRAGETGEVTVSVTNVGDAPAYQVRAMTDSDERFFDERELLFGRIMPGEAKDYKLKLSIGEHELSKTARIDFALYEHHGAKLAGGSQTTLDINAEGLPRPKFAYGYQIIDDPRAAANIRGNGDGALQVGERVRLKVHVKNAGEGNAIDTWVNLRNLSGEAVFLHTGREQIGGMHTGTDKIVDLDFEVKRLPEDGEARLRLAVIDNKLAEMLSETVVFPIRTDAATLTTKSAGITSSGTQNVTVFANPYESRAIAEFPPKTKLRSSAHTPGFYRVDLGNSGFGFVREAEVGTLERAPAKSGLVTPLLAVTPPRIMLVGTTTQTDDTRVHLSGVAEDEDQVRDVFITVTNPSRELFGHSEKVFYQASANPKTGRLEFAADVPLTPGNNLIEIHAREDEDLVGVRSLWVLRTSGLAEARAQGKTSRSTGKLSVDTFQRK